jgi:hypothetical protein
MLIDLLSATNQLFALIACSEIAFYSIILAELTHNPICVTKIF